VISIVTPSLKQLDWLKLAIASVADQEDCQTEHIIQDAGTAGIDNFFAEQAVSLVNAHYQPKLFVEKDDGMYDAVNRGLIKAKGDICAYLNCDEQYLPRALPTVQRFFDHHPEIDVLFGDVVLVDQQGDPISYRRMILPRLRHIRASHLNTLSCGMFFRRRLIDEGFLFDPNWKDVGDAIWIENLLCHDIRMATINEPLAIFSFTGQNRSADAVARLERSQRAAANRLAAAFRHVLVAEHRLRKAFAGAYKRRDLEICIYTAESPRRRQKRQARGVGYHWPI
jgi:glycosyltransferase involved in cell wall biosynthesis